MLMTVLPDDFGPKPQAHGQKPRKKPRQYISAKFYCIFMPQFFAEKARFAVFAIFWGPKTASFAQNRDIWQHCKQVPLGQGVAFPKKFG